MKSEINALRFVPSNYNGHHESVAGKCEVFYTIAPDARGKFYAIGYSGKGRNSSFHYSFSTEQRMRDYTLSFIHNCEKVQADKITRKAAQKEMAANVKVEVGDIFCHSFGYDQTNIDFYQVVSVKGKTANLKSISGKKVEGTEGYMCCRVTPVKDSFTDNGFITKRIQSYNGTPYFSMSCGSMSKTSVNESHYCSWYA